MFVFMQQYRLKEAFYYLNLLFVGLLVSHLSNMCITVGLHALCLWCDL